MRYVESIIYVENTLKQTNPIHSMQLGYAISILFALIFLCLRCVVVIIGQCIRSLMQRDLLHWQLIDRHQLQLNGGRFGEQLDSVIHDLLPFSDLVQLVRHIGVRVNVR